LLPPTASRFFLISPSMSVPTFATPPVLTKLIEKGALGQKTGAGFYRKVGKDILRLDPATGEYVAGGGKADEIVARLDRTACGLRDGHRQFFPWQGVRCPHRVV